MRKEVVRTVRRLFFGFISFSALFLLQSCKTYDGTPDPDPFVPVLDNAKPCCAAFADMAFMPLTFAPETKFSIESTDPVFTFGSNGPSFFKAFQLPERDNSYKLSIRSRLYGVRNRVGTHIAAVLLPIVTLLDGSKHPLYTTTKDDLRHVSFSGPLGAYNVELDLRQHPSARYLIVHTSRDLVVNGMPYIVPTSGMMIPAGGAYVTTPEQTAILYSKTTTPPDQLRILMQE